MTQNHRSVTTPHANVALTAAKTARKWWPVGSQGRADAARVVTALQNGLRGTWLVLRHDGSVLTLTLTY